MPSIAERVQAQGALGRAVVPARRRATARPCAGEVSPLPWQPRCHGLCFRLALGAGAICGGPRAHRAGGAAGGCAVGPHATPGGRCRVQGREADDRCRGKAGTVADVAVTSRVVLKLGGGGQSWRRRRHRFPQAVACASPAGTDGGLPSAPRPISHTPRTGRTQHSYFQPAIDHTVKTLQSEYNRERPIIFNTYQCYLKGTYEQLREDIARAKREGFKVAGAAAASAVQPRTRTCPIRPPSPAQRCHAHSVVDLTPSSCAPTPCMPAAAACALCPAGGRTCRQASRRSFRLPPPQTRTPLPSPLPCRSGRSSFAAPTCS